MTITKKQYEIATELYHWTERLLTAKNAMEMQEAVNNIIQLTKTLTECQHS